MGKKHKHRLKEIERLRALYSEVQAKASEPTSMSSQTPMSSRDNRGSVTEGVSSSPTTEAATVSDSHGYIKKDLVGLVVLIVVMLAVLIGFNWLVVNTAFSGWLFGLLGV